MMFFLHSFYQQLYDIINSEIGTCSLIQECDTLDTEQNSATIMHKGNLHFLASL